MAHHSATKKAIRQNDNRTQSNTFRRTQAKSAIKAVVAAVEGKDAKTAQAALVTAQSKLFRAVKNGVVKKETAARKLSRLNASIKAIAGKKKK